MTNAGMDLEARVQRLFLAQGIFAERSLLPAIDGKHKLLATDIDVLVSEYSSGFHLTRRHAECKSGRRIRILDRVLWLSGVRTMLGADASYLVLTTFNEDAADFARNMGVNVMTVRQLSTWESALGISENQWPNRSNVKLFEPNKRLWLDLGKKENALNVDKFVRHAIQFVEIDSWHVFGYRLLNRLFRILKGLSDLSRDSASSISNNVSSRYVTSALLVRLSQYLLAMCHDVSCVPVSDLHSYLQSRLIFGDQDAIRARGLVDNTARWISHALKDRNIAMPIEVDLDRLFQPPKYADSLTSLIQMLLMSPIEARYLPLAIDTMQFGSEGETEQLIRLRAAYRAALDIALRVKGFAIASLGIEPSLLTPVRKELAVLSGGEQFSQTSGMESSSSQPNLDFGLS